MLKLKNIVKNYVIGDMTVRALRGVSLNFRRSDFVSVLGPSGCGKTTMLNIIGGLDRLTDGELVIDGRSTKDFKDKDWDVYRNRRIGFVFQSYNLIPHQTVLSNVELALTIAGMNKQERRARAKAALDKVGLSDQYYKRPNQLSGGQSQRVAIARALVNDPEILLADEPTGALDTVTSKQIMELVKEIARERLVIMVTHNAELAEEYSTRIIRLLDGELVSDSRPYSEEEEEADVAADLALKREKEEEQERADDKARQELERIFGEERRGQKNAAELQNTELQNTELQNTESQNTELKGKGKGKKPRKKEKAKMSFFTAFKLSLQNLFTKKRRTIMTSIAGSIGIIGVSLVLAVSYGVQTYINNMQNDMLSGNPITIEERSLNISAMMQMSGSDARDIVWENGKVNVNSTIADLVKRSENMSNIMQSNEITQEYIDYVLSLPKEDAAAVFLDYGLDLTNNIYTDFTPAVKKPSKNQDGTIDSGDGEKEVMSLAAIKSIYSSVLSETEYSDYAGYIGTLENSFRQITDNDDYILGQYNLLEGGRYATKAGELMLVLRRDGDGYHWLSDMLLAQLGFYSQNEFMNLVFRATQSLENKSAEYIPQMDRFQFKYQDFINKDFIYYPNSVAFEKAEHKTSIEGIGNVTYVPELNAMDISAFHHRAYENDFEPEEKESGIPLKIVGILEPKADLSYGSLSSGFFYTEALRDRIFEIEKENESEIVSALVEKGSFSSNIVKYIETSETKIMTGVVFDYKYVYPYDGNTQARTAYATVGAASQFSGMANMFGGMMAGVGGGSANLSQILEALNAKTLSLRHLSGRRVERASLELKAFVDGHEDKALQVAPILAQGQVSDLEYDFTDKIHTISATVAGLGQTRRATLTLDKKGAVKGYECDCDDEEEGEPCAHAVAVACFYIAEAGRGAESITLTPIILNETIANSISVYPVDFKTKDNVLAYLARWNQLGEFTYTNRDGVKVTVSADRTNVEPQDLIGLIIGLINTMISMVTIALVAFTSLSLVVSTVMIGIITYVSVVERIKEIGVIRSLGGRKRDVSNLFMAETFIIGFVSGLIGIIFTYLASLIINLIVKSLAGIAAIAIFPWHYAVIMVAISVFLTLFSGATPARSAARKDPVEALRTE